MCLRAPAATKTLCVWGGRGGYRGHEEKGMNRSAEVAHSPLSPSPPVLFSLRLSVFLSQNAEAPFEIVDVHPAGEEAGIGHDFLVQGDIGLDAVDDHL